MNETVSQTEYCKKIFDLVKKRELEELKYLFFAKQFPSLRSSVRKALLSLYKKELKKKLSPSKIDRVESSCEEHFENLYNLGKKVEESINKYLSNNGEEQNCSMNTNFVEIQKFFQISNELFSDKSLESWTPVFDVLKDIKFYNYKNLKDATNSPVNIDEKNNFVSNPESLKMIFDSHDKHLEIHAEILAKFIADIKYDTKLSLNDIGISKAPCFLCGVTFSVIDNTSYIITHGKYMLQKGLDKILSVTIQENFPPLQKINFQAPISNGIQEKLPINIKDDIISTLNASFDSKSIFSYKLFSKTDHNFIILLDDGLSAREAFDLDIECGGLLLM